MCKHSTEARFQMIEDSRASGAAIVRRDSDAREGIGPHCDRPFSRLRPFRAVLRDRADERLPFQMWPATLLIWHR